MRLAPAAATTLGWLVAAAWGYKAVEFLLNKHRVPNVLAPEFNFPLRADAPCLAVIVPARDEEVAVEATLRSLLAQEGLPLEVIAVDDRSTDRTGALLDALAAQIPALKALHVRELPPGWMGKQNALATGVSATHAPYLLFTDGDIFFRLDALRRAMNYMLRERADHLVLLPTPEIKSFGERMMLSAMQVYSVFAVRLWKVADPRSRRDRLGVGAFNLVRREAYEAIGGMATLRMEVLEDVRLGVEIKRHGLRQRVVFGAGLVMVHWAEGISGIVRVVTKNLFAAFQFNAARALGGALSLAAIGIYPALGFFGPPAWRAASALTVLFQSSLYRALRREDGSGPAYALLLPAATVCILYALLRSAFVTLVQGAVIWRGTAYPLKELRASAGPLF